MRYISGNEFLKNKAELEETIRLIDAGKLKSYTIDEAEKMIDELMARKGLYVNAFEEDIIISKKPRGN